MTGADAALLRAYFETRWRLHPPGGPIDVSFDRPCLDPEIPLAVVTAYNPSSVLLAPEENESRNVVLRRRLEESGARWYPAVAFDTAQAGAEWTEPGFAVVSPGEAWVVDLARSFQQNAVLWIDRDGVPSILVTRRGFCGSEAGVYLRPRCIR